MSNLSSATVYSTLSGSLTESLALRRPPIAISFADAMPKGVTNFAGRAPAGCRFWEDAANGAFGTSAVDHSLCAVGIYTHNLLTTPGYEVDLADALKVFQQLGYVREADIATIPVLQSQYRHVVYSPLAETPLTPDIVILFVDANQTLILSEATQQVENANAPAMGRPACAVVPQVMNTGRAALSLGCCGARAYLDTLTDGMAIFAIPGAKLEAYTQRIEELAKANAVLSKFHALRRREIAAGLTPTVGESLEALKTGSSAQ